MYHICYRSNICIENPSILGFTNAFAKGAKLNGASILEDCPVTKINVDSDNNVQSVTVGHEQVNNFISFKNYYLCEIKKISVGMDGQIVWFD